MPSDKQRLDFLESLLKRPERSVRGYQYYKSTDIHIRGPVHCVLMARTGIGSQIEFSGSGETVREMIDKAMKAQ